MHTILGWISLACGFYVSATFFNNNLIALIIGTIFLTLMFMYIFIFGYAVLKMKLINLFKNRTKKEKSIQTTKKKTQPSFQILMNL